MSKSFYPADILIPKTGLEKWSVIACDQYTSEPEYWATTEKTVGDSPSALRVILPEVYLQPDNAGRIAEINKTMKEYLDGDIFTCLEKTFVLTQRVQSDGKLRTGIVGMIDLDDYSYESGADTLIRATEQTVLERIPPRVEIRKDAVLEIPHIMLLIDDPDKTVIEPVAARADRLEKIYDFTLMQHGGSIKGFALDGKAEASMDAALEALRTKSESGMLFAVGDGNHSLATAKECYRLGKGSRYALVEVVNIHDDSLQFEPIYRLMTGVDPRKLTDQFVAECGGETTKADCHRYTLVAKDFERDICLKADAELAVADLQVFLDRYMKNHPEAKIDYIHGEENLTALAKKDGSLGFLFDGMEKNQLFSAITADGSLPRKTFSMGHADDKRFYLEARKL